MPLHLKRTPAEEYERARRKAYKAAKRAAKRQRKHADDGPSSKPDYDTIRAELEEMEFREKMWGAFEDDERLDGIDARFNDYAHIPDRWSRDAHDAADPRYMDDDEYAEWIRQGMWKKKNAREYEEQAKRNTEKASKKAREKHIKAETSRMERLVREQEERRRKDRQRKREEDYRQQYEQRWRTLLDPHTQDQEPLTMKDIPWPLFSTTRRDSGSKPISVEEITPEAVSAFLLLDVDGTSNASQNDDVATRHRDKLKETLLRFHPDKFEGRFMRRVIASDMESVREAVGQVTRALNFLMNGHS